MAERVTEDLVVPAGHTRTYRQNSDGGTAAALFFAEMDSDQPSLTNYGTMIFEAAPGNAVQRFISFATTSFWDEVQISNYGIISAVVPYHDDVIALYASSWSPDLVNAGTLEAAATVRAIGYESWDNNLTITNLSSGSISATAGESVFALYMPNGATVNNAGEITATATDGEAARNAYAMSLPNGRAVINNSGLIEAIDYSANPYATAIGFGAGGQSLVTNSGTIRGDYAIKESNRYEYDARSNVDNTGLIEGRISLLSGYDFVRNAGQIVGDVELGADSDVYDGARGSLVGTVLGGEGSDLLIGGSGSESLDGGAGDDILVGGGGDALTGGLGRDIFVYTEVSGTVETITDFERGTDRIDLRALSPQSVVINGSTITATTGSGTLTINVTGRVAMSDILTVSTTTVFGTDDPDTLVAGPGGTEMSGYGGADVLYGGNGADILTGGLGDDLLNGGAGVDTAIVSGLLSDYTVTQGVAGVFTVIGPDGADALSAIEYLQFDDQTIRLLPGTGVSVNFETSDPSVYQSAMNAIRDFDGNALGGNGNWLRIGSADVDGDGDIDQILVNDAIGRFATVGGTDDGLAYFSDYSWAGETRVAGIYVDPLVLSGQVAPFSDEDSQRRFQNDLQIENINRVLGADDYDGDGLQEVYFGLTDGTAYLHAYMHADGNIQYANYQSEQQVIDYLTANGYDSGTWADWFGAGASAGADIDAKADIAASRSVFDQPLSENVALADVIDALSGDADLGSASFEGVSFEGAGHAALALGGDAWVGQWAAEGRIADPLPTLAETFA